MGNREKPVYKLKPESVFPILSGRSLVGFEELQVLTQIHFVFCATKYNKGLHIFVLLGL